MKKRIVVLSVLLLLALLLCACSPDNKPEQPSGKTEVPTTEAASGNHTAEPTRTETETGKPTSEKPEKPGNPGTGPDYVDDENWTPNL